MIRGALTVAVERDGALTPVSKHASRLRYKRTAQGGDAILSVDLALPDEIGPITRIVVTDTTTGDPEFDGYIEWPTPVQVNGLSHYEISAVGGQALFSDTIRQHYYCDSVEMLNRESWTKKPLNTPGATAEVSGHPNAADPGDAPAIVLQFPESKTLAPGQRVAMDYRLPLDAGRTLYRLGATREGGVSTSMIEARVYTWNASTSTWTLNTHLSGGVDTAISTLNGWIGAGTLDSGQSAVRLELRHTSVGVINAPDNYWNTWWNLHATASLYRKDGTWREFADYPNPGQYPGVRADMIVEDLITRHLSDLIDAPGARIDEGTHLIDQFTRMEGARDREILDSLTAWEPDFYWKVGPRGRNGKHSFEWRRWPTEPRYVLPASGEFIENGPEITLCNRVTVQWRSHTGADRFTVVTTSVPALGSRVRDAEPVTLPEGFGSELNATRIGQQVLAATNAAATSGTVVVTGPIYDNVLRREVAPWNIQPGELITLTARGEAVRINEVDYDDEGQRSVLAVGMETPGLDQLVGSLGRTREDFRRTGPRYRGGRGSMTNRRKKKRGR